MKVAIACDHAGYERKLELISHLEEKGYEFVDFGCNSLESCDYPDYVHPLAVEVEKGEFQLGLILCGSANGVNMTANKHAGIRSALCWMPEIAVLAREHNNANVCALPARFTTKEETFAIAEAFLTTDFEGGRHQRRVDKISK